MMCTILLSFCPHPPPFFFSLLQLQFVSPSAEEFDILQRQLKARIEEGQGETICEVGVGGRDSLPLNADFPFWIWSCDFKER